MTAESEPAIVILDSITRVEPSQYGAVLVAGSHGGLYAAYTAALGRPRGVILNDAGVGKDAAGIAGIGFLEELGIAAAAVTHASARIGDGADMIARGLISHANGRARALGVVPGMICAEAAERMTAAQPAAMEPPPKKEARFLIRARPDEPEILGIDSNSLVTAEDRSRILITGSHGQLLGNRPETALKHDALAAVYNDAGCGIDGAGTSRLPALDARGIPAMTVSHISARIGDARSTWSDGIVSRVNETAARAGARPRMTTVEAIQRVIAALARR